MMEVGQLHAGRQRVQKQEGMQTVKVIADTGRCTG